MRFNKRLRKKQISIHALCEEGDIFIAANTAKPQISIHALCEEGDNSFQCSQSSRLDFYPRPLRGGRRRISDRCKEAVYISIHALCEEGDSD